MPFDYVHLKFYNVWYVVISIDTEIIFQIVITVLTLALGLKSVPLFSELLGLQYIEKKIRNIIGN